MVCFTISHLYALAIYKRPKFGFWVRIHRTSSWYKRCQNPNFWRVYTARMLKIEISWNTSLKWGEIPHNFQKGYFLRSIYISEVFTLLGHFYQVEGTFFVRTLYMGCMSTSLINIAWNLIGHIVGIKTRTYISRKLNTIISYLQHSGALYIFNRESELFS